MVALRIEIVGALGIGEGRRVAEDQVVLAAVGLQPAQGVGLHQAMRLTFHAVQRQILRRPFQIRRRQIHAGGLRGAPDGGVHAGRAGVGEKIQETRALRFAGDAQAQRPMVEEQSGVEIVEQVHAQLRAAFAHDDELVAPVHAPVLAASLRARTRLRDHLLARQGEDLAQRRQQIAETPARIGLGNGARRLVFLHMQETAPLAVGLHVHVHRRRVFRQVGVVNAIAVDAIAFAPGLEALEVLAQAVGDHGRAFAQRRGRPLFARRGRHRVADDQRALQRTVEHRVLLRRPQPRRLRQVLVAAEQAGAPAGHGAAQGVAEFAIQRRVGGEALVVGRIANDDAAFDAGRDQRGYRPAIEADQFGHAGAIGVGDRRAQGVRVGIGAEEHRLQRRATRLGARLRVLHQARPQRRIELQPATGLLAAPALQARRFIGGHQHAFDQQGAAAAHGVEQGAAFGMDLRPLAAQQHRGGEVFLQRRFALRGAPAAAMQGATADIQRQDRPALAHQQVYAHIGRSHVHRRARAVAGADAVDDGVLDALRGVTFVRERRSGYMRVDRQRPFRRDVLVPVDRMHALVEILFVGAIELGQRPQHATGQARFERGAVQHHRLALGIDAGDRRRGAARAQRQQLIDQQVFQALAAGNKKVHCSFCSKRANSSPQNSTWPARR